MSIPFLYVHGSNNAFVLVDELIETWFATDAQRRQFSQSICTHRSAEGVLFVSEYRDGYRMRMFNPDGSEAEMCGNGLRCAARRVLEYSGASTASIWVTDRWFAVGWEDPVKKTVCVRLPSIGFDPTTVGIWLPTGASPVLHQRVAEFWAYGETSLVVMPNPHAIVFVPSHYTQSDRVALATQLGKRVLAMPAIFTQGCNVTVAQVNNPGQICAQTYERGVGLTPACGTAMGATSVAYALKNPEWLEKKLTIRPSGEPVTTCVHYENGQYSIELIGNATVVYGSAVSVDEQGTVLSD